MADSGHPPGRDSRAPYCVNCGQDGHWAFACPEPTRAVPAGARGSADNSNQGNPRDSHQGRRSKAVVTKYQPPPTHPGMIVTRYPPAPPPPGHYIPPPPPPVPPSYPGSQPSYPAYPPPPPSEHYGPPPSHRPPHAWESSYGPPPPRGQHPSAGPPYGPPPSIPHYSQPPPAPAWGGEPPSHAPPYGPPPGSYHGSYANPPPPGYGPPPPQPTHHYPGPPSHAYPPPYVPPPHTDHSAGSYHHPPPPLPPPPSRGPSRAPRPPGQHPSSSPPSRAASSFRASRPPLPPPNLPPRPPSPPRPQTFRDKQGRKKNKKNHRGADRRERQGFKAIDRPETRDSTKDDQVKEQSKPEVASPSTPMPGMTELVQDGDDFDWELKAIFQEPESQGADEIGKPLPSPAHYHDDIILPRAWDASTIDSDYLKEEKYREVFFTSIRKTRFWKYLQYDTIFWVNGRAPETKSQAPQQAKPRTFDKTPQEILGRPPSIPLDTSLKDSHHDRKRSRPSEEYHRDDRHRRERDNDSPRYSPPPKRHRGDDDRRHRSPPARLARDSSPRDSPQERSYRPSHWNNRVPSDHLRAHEGHSSEEPASRDNWDSGQPAHSSQRRGSDHRRTVSGPPHSEFQSKGQLDSRTSSRRSSIHSRASSRQSIASHDSGASELSWLEAALLGLPGKEEVDKEADDRESDLPRKPLKPKRRSAPRMDSVYSRRW